MITIYSFYAGNPFWSISLRHLLLVVLATLCCAGCNPEGVGLDAARRGDWDALSRRIDNGLDVNCVDAKGRSLLFLAAQSGHDHIVAELLAADASPAVHHSRAGGPAHAAAAEGHLPSLRLLIQAGVDIESLNRDGDTLLRTAVRNGQVTAVKYLVEIGADVNATDKDGNAMLPLAASRHNALVVELLLKAGAYVDDANERDGFTALHVAAQSNDRELVELLLNWRANVALTDADGYTPAENALVCGHKEIAYLLQHVIR